MNLANQLGALVLNLRAPSASFTERQTKLRAAAYYLPQVKNPQNVALILNELGQSPGLLTGDEREDLPTIRLAVDAISHAANRKRQISDPTMTYTDWEKLLLQSTYQTAPIFGLVLISGLYACGAPISHDLVQFVDTVTKISGLLAAACLSRAQQAQQLGSAQTQEFFNQVVTQLDPTTRAQIVEAVMKNVYNPTTIGALGIGELAPAEFGAWSRTLSQLLRLAPLVQLCQFLDVLQLYVGTAMSLMPPLDHAKALAFGVTVQVEGLMAQVITSHAIRQPQRVELVGRLLRSIQPLGYVFDAMGTQFSSYQFVSSSALDVLQAATPLQRIRTLETLGRPWAFGQKVNSEVSAGGLLFFFETSEPLLPLLTADESEAVIIPIAQRFLEPSRDRLDLDSIGPAVFEAAHSIMLAYLVTHQSRKFAKTRTALTYFAQVIQLFPEYLSARQLRTAVGAILRAVPKEEIEPIFHRLFQLAKGRVPGLEMPPPRHKQPVESDDSDRIESGAVDGSVLPTVRAAYVSTLLHAVADYAEATTMGWWLRQIGAMVPQAYSPGTEAERKFLIQDFRDTVVNLGDYADIGIRWFFGDGWSKM